MKKSKISLMALAAIAALTTAFATRPECFQCEDTQQYRWNGQMYVALGTFGIDYDCDPNIQTCTYYKPNPITQPNVYAACRLGTWIDLGARAEVKK